MSLGKILTLDKREVIGNRIRAMHKWVYLSLNTRRTGYCELVPSPSDTNSKQVTVVNKSC